MNIKISIEELNHIESLTEEYETLSNEVHRLLDLDESAYRELGHLVSIGDNDNIATEARRLNDITEHLYGTLSFESTEEISTELLTATKIRTVVKLTKTISDIRSSILDQVEQVKAISGMLSAYKIEKLEILKEQLESNDIVPRDRVRDYMDCERVQKKLAIYYELVGSKLDNNKLQELLEQPYEIIVKYQFFKILASYVADELVKPESERRSLPEQPDTLKYINTLDSEELVIWKEKNIKAGMIDRFIGERFGMITLSESDTKKIISSYTYFNIPKDRYTKDLDIWDKKDMISLLDYGIDSKDKFKKISKAISQGYILSKWKDLTDGMLKQLVMNSGVLIGMKSSWTEINTAGSFYRNLVKGMLMQHRTVKTTPDLIVDIIIGMTEQEQND